MSVWQPLISIFVIDLSGATPPPYLFRAIGLSHLHVPRSNTTTHLFFSKIGHGCKHTLKPIPVSRDAGTRTNSQCSSAVNNCTSRRSRITILLFLARFAEQPKCRGIAHQGAGRRDCTADVSADAEAEYYVGSKSEWWQRCGYDGEDIEWQRIRECESQTCARMPKIFL